MRKHNAETHQAELKKRIQELEPVKKVYEENTKYRNIANEYATFDDMTKSQAENLYRLINDLEKVFPTTSPSVKVKNFNASENRVSMTMEADVKMTVAQLLINLHELTYLKDISIPSISEVTIEIEDMDGNLIDSYTVWDYTLSFTLTNIDSDNQTVQ